VIFSPIILNAGSLSEVQLDQPIDIALTLSMADLKAQFIDSERGQVQYHAIHNSEEFQKYKGLTSRLQSFDLQSLKDRKQKLAFWINIYNAAVIHGVIELGLKKSVKEVSLFFDRIMYKIGGYRFSLNDMEHGILRGNRRPPYRLWRPFGKNDPRLAFAVLPMDPRIHFALVCGARSCPPIGFYEADQVDFQLQLAAESFVNSLQVRILPEENSVLISSIFKWYKADFGGSDRAMVDTILHFLDEGEKKIFLRENRNQIRMKYQPYDWNLNQKQG
jgi:hypothetical protein